jgi:CRISPR-associated protein Csb2
VDPADYRGKRPWFEALTYSSNDLLKERLSGPPAMRSVPYELPVNAVSTWLPTRRPPRPRHVSAAVLELHAPVLPMATDAIRIAERVRGRLMRLLERSGEIIPPVIHGKDQNGKPLEKHGHLFILPRANKIGRIDHVLLFAKGEEPFFPPVVDAMARIRRLHWFESLRVTTAWMGKFDDRQIRPPAQTVISATPFITVRHWRKGRGTPLDFIKEEIRRECCKHRLPEPVEIEPCDNAGRFPPVKFRRNREGDPPRPGSAFRLHFSETVATPFALGYGCHFGLGQFEAAER